METEDDFDKLMQNAVIYGTGVLLMCMDENGQLSTRIVPIEEYAQLGKHLEWIQQNTKVTT